VGETIDIPWAKDEAATQLKGIRPEFVLTVPGGASAVTALEIVAAKYVKHAGDAQIGEFVSLALFVDEQWKVDSRLFLEDSRVVPVAKADGCEGSAFVEEGLLVFAQLRDVLTAKNSSIVAQKNDDFGLALPQ